MDYLGAIEDRKTYYRIVPYRDYGIWYKVQIWRWWWPMWKTIDKMSATMGEAERIIYGRTMYFEGIR